MSRPHLLVIDEKSFAKSLEEILRTDYFVTLAYGGVQGLKTARRIVPALIILEVDLPEMAGIDVCQKIRADSRLSHIPVLFLSDIADIEARVQAFEAGADDYVVKSFDKRELLLRIRAALRRSQALETLQPSAKNLQDGDFRLDCQTSQVTIGSSIVRLTPIEFDLLYHLMQHSGQTFSSNRLLQEVWDFPSDTGSPDVVRMHIKNLRHKIESDPRHPTYIQTVPRHGYIFISRSNSMRE